MEVEELESRDDKGKDTGRSESGRRQVGDRSEAGRRQVGGISIRRAVERAAESGIS